MCATNLHSYAWGGQVQKEESTFVLFNSCESREFLQVRAKYPLFTVMHSSLSPLAPAHPILPDAAKVWS